MGLVEIVVLVVAVGVMLAIAVGMTRWSQKKYDELRQVAAESDRAMVEAARVLGLEFVPRAPHEHPLMGTIPAFGVVRGVLRGVPVKVTINVDTERGFAKTELSAELGDGPHEERLDGPSRSSERYRLERDGTKLKMFPHVERKGTSQFIVYGMVTNAGELVSLLEELAQLGARR